jgi:transcriptional regulator with XRE-family HTH domain
VLNEDSDDSVDQGLSDLGEYVAARLTLLRKRPSVAADGAGINRSQFSAFLKGRKRIGREKLLLLATEIEVPVAELLRRAGLKAPLLDPSESLLMRAGAPRTIHVITDARFVDSALFAWMIRQQPFRPFGLECEFVQVDWDQVPEKIEKMGGIGFYNRRATPVRGGQKVWRVSRWTDMSLYKGYAILGRKNLGIDETPRTHQDARLLLATLVDRRQKEGRRPTILTFGTDAEWRVERVFVRDFPARTFEVITVGDADQALAKYLADDGTVFDLFIGGLPQRLRALRHPDVLDVLSIQNNPAFFSLNSLVYADVFLQTPRARAILAAVEALWFDTIDRIRQQEGLRETVLHEVLRDLDTLSLGYRSLDSTTLGLVLPGGSADNEYEVFPSQPSDLLDAFLALTHRLEEDGGDDDRVSDLSLLRYAAGEEFIAPA